jgi:hypothetical protein
LREIFFAFFALFCGDSGLLFAAIPLVSARSRSLKFLAVGLGYDTLILFPWNLSFTIRDQQ